jgi:hypothetical protein
VQSHYLPKRSRRQPSILTFLAQDADSQVFRYSNADIRKGKEADEVFRFIDFWTRHHGSAPLHLVFDSKLTTYAGLDRLDEAEITFMTLRRRSPALLKEIVNLPASPGAQSPSICRSESTGRRGYTRRRCACANAHSASSSSRILGTTNRRSW